jgi:hypothetical protein
MLSITSSVDKNRIGDIKTRVIKGSIIYLKSNLVPRIEIIYLGEGFLFDIDIYILLNR